MSSHATYVRWGQNFSRIYSFSLSLYFKRSQFWNNNLLNGQSYYSTLYVSKSFILTLRSIRKVLRAPLFLANQNKMIKRMKAVRVSDVILMMRSTEWYVVTLYLRRALMAFRNNILWLWWRWWLIPLKNTFCWHMALLWFKENADNWQWLSSANRKRTQIQIIRVSTNPFLIMKDYYHLHFRSWRIICISSKVIMSCQGF